LSRNGLRRLSPVRKPPDIAIALPIAGFFEQAEMEAFQGTALLAKTTGCQPGEHGEGFAG